MQVDVKYIAHLSRLELGRAEAEKLGRQFQDILLYVDRLKSLNTEEVPPYSIISRPGFLENVFRKDEIRPSLKIHETLMNAPQKKGNFFKVPKIIK